MTQVDIKYNKRNNDSSKLKTLLLKDVKFELPKSFLKKYIGKQPAWGALGYIIYKRTYARVKYGYDDDLDVYIYERLTNKGEKIYFSRCSKEQYKDLTTIQNSDLSKQVVNMFVEKVQEENGGKVEIIPSNNFVNIYKRIDEAKFEKIELLTEEEFQKKIGITNDEEEDKLTLTGRTEEFWETLKRVVEGVFRIQKWHCKMPQNNYEWKEREAKKTAIEMYEAIWQFKFFPAGRSFWMMGTPFLEKNGSMALNNCFAYNTEIITANGIKKIGDCNNTTQCLLSSNGKWIDAPIKSFGKQKLMKLTIKRNGIIKEIFTTENHRWFASSRKKEHRSGKTFEVITKDLQKNDVLSYMFGQGIKNIIPSPFGIAHGICYGDGNDGHITLCDKKVELQKYFPLNKKSTDNKSLNCNSIYIANLPLYFKQNPSLSESKSYLYGWLIGYFSTDGSCDTNGSCRLSSSKINNIYFVRDVCSLLGIGYYSIIEEDRVSNLDNKMHKLYTIRLMKDTLNEHFCIRSDHKDNYNKSNGENTEKRFWNVVSVEETNKEEEVYCAIVEDTHTFTLADNILTGNCGFTTTADYLSNGSKSHRWLMDCLMLGVGVGFDVLGGMKVPKVCDIITYTDAEKIAQAKIKNMPIHEIETIVNGIPQKLKDRLSEYIYIADDVKLKLPKEEYDQLYMHELFVQYYANELVKTDRAKEDNLIKEVLLEKYNKLSKEEKEKYVIIKQPRELSETYIIPDSREGWVKAIGYVCDAFYYSEDDLKLNNEIISSDPDYDSEKNPLYLGLPKFDFSKVRKKGEAIRGFGGTASGPEPLIDLLNYATQIFKERVGQVLRTTDIIDLMTNEGKCVVAGNVRRSALISLGELDDYGFMNKKNPEIIRFNHINKEYCDSWWASNNSVVCKVGSDYTEISKLIAKNGEPGIVWIDNAREYGRMREDERNFEDMKVIGVNPCFHPDTLIAVADGRNAVSIKQLADEGKDIPVYSVNTEGMIEIKMGRNPRITGYDQELLKITLDDGSSLIVTPNHKMRLLNGEYLEAQNLKIDDSLPRFSKYTAKVKQEDAHNYFRINCNTLNTNKNKIFEHRLIMQFYNPKEWNNIYDENEQHGFLHGNIVVHHKDENGLNNNINNLEILKFSDHNNEHNFYDVAGENNPMFNKQHSDETKKLIGEKTKERCKDNDYKEKLSQSISEGMNNDHIHQKLSDSRYKELHKFYEEFLRTTDLKTKWVGEQLFVIKNCETCKKEFEVPVAKRERAYCSISCANSSSNTSGNKARSEGQKKYFANKQKDTLHQQIMIYKNLEKKLNKSPMKKEWEEECKKQKISIRFNPKSENEFVLASYKQLQEKAVSYNHRVLKIEKLAYKSNVYNITVDDNHTIGIITTNDNNNYSGIFTFQCGEQSLEDKELCNLCETFPSLHESWEDYKKTLRLAHLYAKSVTLLNTHWSETNSVMHRNRRMGISQSGIIDAIVKHGRHELLEWCKKGYEEIKRLDANNNFMCVGKSKKYTTVKPSGCMREDTLVNTKSGIYRLNELGFTNGNQWQNISYKTTHNKDITKFYINGKVNTKIITTLDGNELESSYIHKYKIYNGDYNTFDPSKIIWKEAQELTNGDKLVCILNDYTNEIEPKLKIENFEHHTNNNIITQPEYMNEKLAWFIGYMFANGSIHEKGIRLHFNRIQDSLARYIINIVKDLFNIDAILDDDTTIYISSLQLKQYLNNNNLLKSYSKDISVPLLIRTASKKSIHAFINGFWRGDGGQQKISTWTLCSVSKKFILELFVLCRAIGINVKISNAGCGGYGSLDRWILQSRLNDPNKIQYAPKELRSRCHKHNDIIYWIDVVENIIDSENFTYDISVPDTNEYIANGVISHNTLSLLSGVSSGIHYPHSKYYIRRVRVDAQSPIAKECARCGYNVYDDPTSEMKVKDETGEHIIYHTKIVDFPMMIEHFDREKKDVPFLEQIMNAIDWQRNWSDNQVSITATFTKQEADAGVIQHGLEFAQHYLKGISCLPLSDHGYKNAPYEAITQDQYEKMMDKITDEIDLSKFQLDQGEGEKFCSNDTCEIK